MLHHDGCARMLKGHYTLGKTVLSGTRYGKSDSGPTAHLYGRDEKSEETG